MTMKKVMMRMTMTYLEPTQLCVESPKRKGSTTQSPSPASSTSSTSSWSLLSFANIIIIFQHYYYLATSSTNIANIIIIFKHCRHHWLPFHYCNWSPPPSTACGSNLPGLLREGRRGSRWSGNKAPLNILDSVLWSTRFDNRCCSANFDVCKKLCFFSFQLLRLRPKKSQDP